MRYLWLLSVLLPLAAQAETYITAENNGCKILNPNPQQDETATWSGACDSEGYADGKGKVEWLIGGELDSWSMGYYRRGRLEGLGRGAIVESGASYRGQWSESGPHGYGVMKWGSNGIRYRGALHKGKAHGLGVWEGKFESYSGSFRENKFHGWGVLKLPKWHPDVEGEYAGKGQWQGGDYFVRGRFAEGRLIAVCNSEAECPPE